MKKTTGKKGLSLGMALQISMTGLIFLLLLVLGLTLFLVIRFQIDGLVSSNLQQTTQLVGTVVQTYTQSTIQNYLRGVSDTNRRLVAYYYGLYREGSMTERAALDAATRIISDPDYARIGETGYIAGVSSEGILRIHPTRQGADLSGQEFMQRAMELRNGYLEYDFAAVEGEPELPKAGYLSYFAPWDIILWASSYRSEFTTLFDTTELSSRIQSTEFSEYGFSFILDANGEIVYCPQNFRSTLVLVRTASGASIAETIPAILSEGGSEGVVEVAAGVGSGDESASSASDYRTLTTWYTFSGTRERVDIGFIPYNDMGWIIGSCSFYSHSHAALTATTLTMGIALGVFIVAVWLVLMIVTRKFLSPLDDIRKISALVSEKKLTRRIDVRSTDEIGEVAGHFNGLIEDFAFALDHFRDFSSTLTQSVQNLSSSSREIATTSNQQAASIKELLTTMEDSHNLSKSISLRSKEMLSVSKESAANVQKGFALIRSSLQMMDLILKTNQVSTTGIKELGEKIESIWDIINIINSIANQTKIIAFNAELEATAAGEAGKNFQIVATEIRRLTDNTVASTEQIRGKIKEIQDSSDQLVEEAEDDAQNIKDSWQFSQKIESVFGDILKASENNAESSEKVAQSIDMQVSSFEQVFQAIRQISEGIEYFVLSTRTMSETAETLQSMSEELGGLVSEYTLEE